MTDLSGNTHQHPFVLPNGSVKTHFEPASPIIPTFTNRYVRLACPW